MTFAVAAKKYQISETTVSNIKRQLKMAKGKGA